MAWCRKNTNCSIILIFVALKLFYNVHYLIRDIEETNTSIKETTEMLNENENVSGLKLLYAHGSSYVAHSSIYKNCLLFDICDIIYGRSQNQQKHWGNFWLNYANSKGCHLTGYNTMEEEFKFYQKLLLSRPNLFREMENIYEQTPLLQPQVWKVVITDGKVKECTCKPGKCSVIDNVAVKSSLTEFADVAKYFKNLTFYLHDGDGAKTNIRRKEPVSMMTDPERCLPPAIEKLSNMSRIRAIKAGGWREPLPFLSVAKITGCDGDILAPSWKFDIQRKACGLVVPWRKKKDSIYWRGTDTGGGINSLRMKVIDALRKTDLKSDVAFSQIGECADRRANRSCVKLHLKIPVRKGIDECLQQKYKFILDIDGNSFSRRFPSLGSSNSCIIRFGLYSTWYHDFLVPGLHYVHMPDEAIENRTLLLEKIPTDKQAEQIARKMTKAAMKVMNDGAKCYWLRLLLHYADTFGFESTI